MYFVCVSLVSWIVMISACVSWISSLSSSSLFLIPFVCCDCDAFTVVCVACVYAERVWWCEVDGNAGVGVAEVWLWLSAGHVGGTRGSGIVSSAADVLWMSVVRGRVWCVCVCVGGRCGWRGRVSGWEDWVWALRIMWEQWVCWTCVCVLVAVVWVV